MDVTSVCVPLCLTCRPRVDDPHGIGSKHVPWVRAAAVEEEEAVEEVAATLSRL